MLEVERTPPETLLATQKQSLELVVTGAPLSDVLRHLVLAVEERAGGGSIASILLLDEERRLRNAASPSLPDDYLQAIDGLPADATLGTCAAAAALAEVVVTPDFATSPGWRGLAHLPLALGLQGAWSMPILARDGSVLGTFGTYFRECRQPTPVERDVVEVLARTAAIAIERDRAESALRAAKEAAEAASNAKSQFLAVMSHELRTPLAGIIGYADLLTTGVVGPLTADQLAPVGRIRAGAWHLVSIIDEILTFSRVEAGKELIHLESVDLVHLVRECAELLRPTAAGKGLDLRLLTPEALGPFESDAGKLRQIVLNLAGNALKFTEEGFVEVSLAEDERQVLIRVRDSGPGIPAANRERIFEPFVQLDQSSTRRNGGTGLGLAVSQRLARLLGGEVEVASAGGGTGSIFTLRLPRPLSLAS
jgi:signal transduction histidine kinase